MRDITDIKYQIIQAVNVLDKLAPTLSDNTISEIRDNITNAVQDIINQRKGDISLCPYRGTAHPIEWCGYSQEAHAGNLPYHWGD